MGRIIRGAQVGPQPYVVKPPALPPAGLRAFAGLPPVDDAVAAAAASLEAEARESDGRRQVEREAARAHAAQLIDTAAGDARALILDARDRAQQLILDAQERAKQIEREAEARGFARGEQDGRAAADAEADGMISTMRGLLEGARERRNAVYEGAEPEIVRLATVIAERVLHQHVAVEPDTVVEMTRSALTRLVARETVTIRVNPEDLERLREHRERFMALNDIEHLRVLEDQRVDRGGVVIETEAGTIDSKIATQMREARRLLAVPDVPSLPAAQAG